MWNRISGKANASSETLDRSSKRARDLDEDKERKSDAGSSATRASKSRGGRDAAYEEQAMINDEGNVDGSTVVDGISDTQHRRDRAMSTSSGKEGKRDKSKSITTQQSEITRDQADRQESRKGRRKSSGGSRREKGESMGESKASRDGDRSSKHNTHASSKRSGSPDGQYSVSPHAQSQFPGQLSSQVSAVYRPPLAASEGGPGLAAEYYGDAGESVAQQPGNRTHSPSLIIGAEPHLMAASSVEAPPPEPSHFGETGAAASFYSGDFDDSVDAIASKPPNSASYQEKPNRPQQGHHSSSAPVVPTLGATAVGAAAGYLLGGGESSQSSKPQNAPQSSNGGVNSSISTHAFDSAWQPSILGGVQASSTGHATTHNGAPARRRKGRHGPLDALVDFVKDPDGVAQYEEYTEFIGICKGCFEPGSSPRDAPRRHRHGSRRSDKRHGHSTRIEKQRRYSSSSSSFSDEEGRRKKGNSWLGAGAASYSLAKMGETLFKQRNDFDDTYDVKSGRFSPSGRNRTAQQMTSWNDKGSRSNVSSINNKDNLASPASAALPVRIIDENPESGSSRKHKARTVSRRSASASTTQVVDPTKPILRVEPLDEYTSQGSKKKRSKRKKHSKKKEGIFGFLSPSSSSSSLELHTSSAKHAKKDRFVPDKKITSDREAEAALLGLGAATAALALQDSRGEKKSRKDRASKPWLTSSASPNKHRPSHTVSSSDEVWESASEGGRSDPDSDLAFGSPERRSSHESLSSLSSGTEKWNWRWGRKTKRRKSSTVDPLSNEMRTHDAPPLNQPPTDSPPTVTHGAAKDSTLQYVYAVPTSDPSQYDVQAQPTTLKQTPIVMSNTPRSEIQQPQPVSRASSILNYSIDHEAAPILYDSDPSPAKPSRSRKHASNVEKSSVLDDADSGIPLNMGKHKLRRSETSPARIPDTSHGELDQSARSSVGRSDSMSVRFAMSEEQEDRERHERRTRRKQEKEAAKSQKRQRRKSKDDLPSTLETSESVDHPRSDVSGESWSIPAAGLAGAVLGATAASHSKEDMANVEETREQRRRRRRRDREREQEADVPTDRHERKDETSPEKHRSDTAMSSRDQSVWKEAARSQRAVHEDYQTFFAPVEVLSESSKEPKISNPDPNADVDLGGPNVIEITPNFLISQPDEPEFSPADTRNVSYDAHDLELPWQVPRLKLVKPTPTPSRASSPLPQLQDTSDSAEADTASASTRRTVNDVSDRSREVSDCDVSAADSTLLEDLDTNNDVREPSHSVQGEENTPSVKAESSSNDDFDFAATLAASAQSAGFDPSIVIDDPSYHRRISPPRSNDVDVQHSSEDEKRSKRKKKDKKKRKGSLAKGSSRRDGPSRGSEEPVEGPPTFDAPISNDEGRTAAKVENRRSKNDKRRKTSSLSGQDEGAEAFQTFASGDSPQSKRGAKNNLGRQDSEVIDNEESSQAHGNQIENDIAKETPVVQNVNFDEVSVLSQLDTQDDRSTSYQKPTSASGSFLDRRPKPPRPPDNADQTSEGQHPFDGPEPSIQATTNDATRSVTAMDSPTAVPVSFRRPGDPVSRRSSSQSPLSSPRVAHDAKPQPRVRPRSTEFKTSKEIRPLWLVERHSSRPVPSGTETYPPLPESQTTSAASSVHDPLENTNDTDWQPESVRSEPESMPLKDNAREIMELLGSEEPTPTVATFKHKEFVGSTEPWSPDKGESSQPHGSAPAVETASDRSLAEAKEADSRDHLIQETIDPVSVGSETLPRPSHFNQDTHDVELRSRKGQGFGEYSNTEPDREPGEQHRSHDHIGEQLAFDAISKDMSRDQVVANMISVASTADETLRVQSSFRTNEEQKTLSKIPVAADPTDVRDGLPHDTDVHLESVASIQDDATEMQNDDEGPSPCQPETQHHLLSDENGEAQVTVNRQTIGKAKKDKKAKKSKRSAQRQGESARSTNAAESNDQPLQPFEGADNSVTVRTAWQERDSRPPQSLPPKDVFSDRQEVEERDPLAANDHMKNQETRSEPDRASARQSDGRHQSFNNDVERLDQDEHDDPLVDFTPIGKKKARKQKRKAFDLTPSEESPEQSMAVRNASDQSSMPSSGVTSSGPDKGVSQSGRDAPNDGQPGDSVAAMNTERRSTAVEGSPWYQMRDEPSGPDQATRKVRDPVAAQDPMESSEHADIEHDEITLEPVLTSEDPKLSLDASDSYADPLRRPHETGDVHMQMQDQVRQQSASTLSAALSSEDVAQAAIEEEAKPSSAIDAWVAQSWPRKASKKAKRKENKTKSVSFDGEVADGDDFAVSSLKGPSRSLRKEEDLPGKVDVSPESRCDFMDQDESTSSPLKRSATEAENSEIALNKDSTAITNKSMRDQVEESKESGDGHEQSSHPSDLRVITFDRTPVKDEDPPAVASELSISGRKKKKDKKKAKKVMLSLEADPESSMKGDLTTNLEAIQPEVQSPRADEGTPPAWVPTLAPSTDEAVTQDKANDSPALFPQSKKKKKGKKGKAVRDFDKERDLETTVVEKAPSLGDTDGKSRDIKNEQEMQEPNEVAEPELQTEEAADTRLLQDKLREEATDVHDMSSPLESTQGSLLGAYQQMPSIPDCEVLNGLSGPGDGVASTMVEGRLGERHSEMEGEVGSTATHSSSAARHPPKRSPPLTDSPTVEEDVPKQSDQAYNESNLTDDLTAKHNAPQNDVPESQLNKYFDPPFPDVVNRPHHQVESKVSDPPADVQSAESLPEKKLSSVVLSSSSDNFLDQYSSDTRTKSARNLRQNRDRLTHPQAQRAATASDDEADAGARPRSTKDASLQAAAAELTNRFEGMDVPAETTSTTQKPESMTSDRKEVDLENASEVERLPIDTPLSVGSVEPMDPEAQRLYNEEYTRELQRLLDKQRSEDVENSGSGVARQLPSTKENLEGSSTEQLEGLASDPGLPNVISEEPKPISASSPSTVSLAANTIGNTSDSEKRTNEANETGSDPATATLQAVRSATPLAKVDNSDGEQSAAVHALREISMPDRASPSNGNDVLTENSAPDFSTRAHDTRAKDYFSFVAPHAPAEDDNKNLTRQQHSPGQEALPPSVGHLDTPASDNKEIEKISEEVDATLDFPPVEKGRKGKKGKKHKAGKLPAHLDSDHRTAGLDIVSSARSEALAASTADSQGKDEEVIQNDIAEDVRDTFSEADRNGAKIAKEKEAGNDLQTFLVDEPSSQAQIDTILQKDPDDWRHTGSPDQLAKIARNTTTETVEPALTATRTPSRKQSKKEKKKSKKRGGSALWSNTDNADIDDKNDVLLGLVDQGRSKDPDQPPPMIPKEADSSHRDQNEENVVLEHAITDGLAARAIDPEEQRSQSARLDPVDDEAAEQEIIDGYIGPTSRQNTLTEEDVISSYNDSVGDSNNPPEQNSSFLEQEGASPEDLFSGGQLQRQVPHQGSGGDDDRPDSGSNSRNRRNHSLEGQRKPSPVDSTTKDRSSALFDASPSGRSLDGAESRPSGTVIEPEESALRAKERPELRQSEPSWSFDRLNSPIEDTEHVDDSRRSLFGGPAAGNFASQGNEDALQNLSQRDKSAALAADDTTPAAKRLHASAGNGQEENVVRLGQLAHEAKERRASRHSNTSGAASMESIRAIIRTPEHVRSSSGQSFRSSATPPLRRTDRSVSSDLRAASKKGEDISAKSDASSKLTTADLDQHVVPYASSSTYDPVKHKGKHKSLSNESMADYEGWGDVHGESPMSPTRPPSLRKLQSTQFSEMEQRLAMLVSDNRLLTSAKSKAERRLEEQADDHRQQRRHYEDALQEHKAYVDERDATLRELNAMVESLREQVVQLTTTNEELLHSRRLDTQEDSPRWQEISREMSDLRIEHDRLQTEHEDIVAAAVSSAQDAKDRELLQLRQELAYAKEEIHRLKQKILDSQSSDDIVERDDDFFDQKCQELFKHLTSWVIRFSKLSDNRRCYMAGEMRNDAHRDLFEDSMLDGAEVDDYLQDRQKRRDVFTSVVMTLIFKHIFARYLFGMDREHRQKLKALDKTLQDVGPPSAVHKWRATTLKLLSQRASFASQRDAESQGVVDDIWDTLSTALPLPSTIQTEQCKESLSRVVNLAIDLSIDMRLQKVEYSMLPPPEPEFDPDSGDITNRLEFDAQSMNSCGPGSDTNEALEERNAQLRLVLFPLVVRVEEDGDKTVIYHAQVQVVPAKKGKTVRVLSAAGNRSEASFADGEDTVMDGGYF